MELFICTNSSLLIAHLGDGVIINSGYLLFCPSQSCLASLHIAAKGYTLCIPWLPLDIVRGRAISSVSVTETGCIGSTQNQQVGGVQLLLETTVYVPVGTGPWGDISQ